MIHTTKDARNEQNYVRHLQKGGMYYLNAENQIHGGYHDGSAWRKQNERLARILSIVILSLAVAVCIFVAKYII
ncbi:MAG: hypothetical protein SCH10_01410 [Nitrosomonadaceae bacterium]|nr:hypothetical protein [Nitrosomonadaceae bacterium]